MTNDKDVLAFLQYLKEDFIRKNKHALLEGYLCNAKVFWERIYAYYGISPQIDEVIERMGKLVYDGAVLRITDEKQYHYISVVAMKNIQEAFDDATKRK